MLIKFIKEHSVFAVILSTCIVLRLIPLFDYQFTLDELSGLERTGFNSFSELIEKGVKIDAHPALVQVLIYYFTKIFGYTNWIIKLPFLLCSFGAVIYAYFFCLKNFSKQTAIIASAVFSFSLVFVFYAPIARMYISGVFFSIALLYYFFELFFLKDTRAINFVWLGLFSLLSAYNQHINALFAFTVFASGLFFLNKNNYKAYLITLVVTVILYLPHLRVTLYQLGVGGIGYEQDGWLEKPEITAAFDFFKILFGTGRSYIIFLALIIACFVLNKKIIFNKKQVYLLILFIVNYLVVYFYSILNAPIFQNSVMLFAGVTLVILISSLLDFKNKYLFNFALAIIIVSFFYKTYYKKDYYHQCVKNVFEYQFEKTYELKKLHGDKNVYPIFFDATEMMRSMYFKKYENSFDCKITGDSVTKYLKNFSAFVAGLNTEYLVLASSYPIQQAIAAEHYPYLIENIQTQGVNYKVYSKRLQDKNKTVEGESVIYFADYFNKRDFKFKDLKMSPEKYFSLHIDSLRESPSGKVKINKITSKEGQIVLFKTTFKYYSFKLHDMNIGLELTDTNTKKSYFFNAANVNEFQVKKDSTVNMYTNYYCGTDYKRIKDTAMVNAFIWSVGDRCTVKKFEISTIDFWPQKWNFWE